MLAVILGHYHKKARYDAGQGPHKISDLGTGIGADAFTNEWPMPIDVHEDNQTCITCVVTSKNPL